MSLLPVPPAAPASYIFDAFETFLGDPLILGGDIVAGEWVPKLQFPHGTKVSISRDTIMSTTNVNGLNGTIKQISGFGDWQISIEIDLVAMAYSTSIGLGALVDSLKPLLDQIEAITDAANLGKRIPILNERLNRLDIVYLVIKKITLPDNPTYYHQPIRIEALSDFEYDLALENMEKKG